MKILEEIIHKNGKYTLRPVKSKTILVPTHEAVVMFDCPFNPISKLSDENSMVNVGLLIEIGKRNYEVINQAHELYWALTETLKDAPISKYLEARGNTGYNTWMNFFGTGLWKPHKSSVVPKDEEGLILAFLVEGTKMLNNLNQELSA